MASSQGISWSIKEGSALDTLPVYVKELMAGGVAGGFSKSAVAPLERIKILVQTRTEGYHSMGVRQSLKRLLKHEGFAGFYKSGPTLMAILPYAGMRFCIYEELKRHVSEEHQRSIVMSLSCGALSGLLGQSVTYPLDVVKRQMQVDSGRYKNTWKAFTTIVSEQGWRQLFAGLGINYIKIVPSMAIGFATYDMMKLSLRIPPRQKTKSASTV
uniref:Putative carrier protein n=1 Tax=Helianthus annuus TaxID=4232 RepID=A0A251V8N9_HELAN